MLNRKLLEVLKHLSAAEKKRLRQFLVSPYFNSGSLTDDVIRLYDLIVRCETKEDHPALSKAAVFAVFFPGRQFLENVKSPLDGLTSRLFHLVRQFLAQSDFERENGEIYEHLSLARFYRKFAFEERFWQTMQTLKNIQRTAPLHDVQYYYTQLQIEQEEFSFRGLYNSFEDGMNLNAAHNNLDLYYSILKLEFTCAQEHQVRFAQIEGHPQTSFIDNILMLIEDGGPLDIPINQIYRLLLNLLKNPESKELLHKLEELLNLYEPIISTERYKSFRAFHRFFWHQVYLKSGNDYSRRHIFEMYQEHLEKGYFYFDGLIPYTAFRNLVMFALILHEFDWVKTFLETHPPERIFGTRYPHEAHSLNVAEYHFYLKEYETALEKLVYRHFENPSLGILSDMLLIKIYYETDNELLDSRMKAIDQKIRRSKLNQETKNRYFNFLKKLDKIIKYGNQKKSPKRERLIAEIKNTSEIVYREWLLEKLGG